MESAFHRENKSVGTLNAYEIIRKAIRKKQQIRAVYDGFERLMCPHVIGTKQGIKKCVFYQFAGGSKSGHSTGWEIVPVDELQNVSAIDGAWYSSFIQQDQPKIEAELDKIDAKIEY